jgi:hypothetical protein
MPTQSVGTMVSSVPIQESRASSLPRGPKTPRADRSHAPRGNGVFDAPRLFFRRGASGAACPRRAWERWCPAFRYRNRERAPCHGASKRRELIVPTLRVVTALLTLRVFFSTRSVGGCMPTQSVGTMVSSVPIPESRASSPHGAFKRRELIVPTLRVVTALLTLRVFFSTRSVGGCMPTQSVGTMMSSVPIQESRAISLPRGPKTPRADRSHAPRGNGVVDAPRLFFRRGASGAACPRRAWERWCPASRYRNRERAPCH